MFRLFAPDSICEFANSSCGAAVRRIGEIFWRQAGRCRGAPGEQRQQQKSGQGRPVWTAGLAGSAESVHLRLPPKLTGKQTHRSVIKINRKKLICSQHFLELFIGLSFQDFHGLSSPPECPEATGYLQEVSNNPEKRSTTRLREGPSFHMVRIH